MPMYHIASTVFDRWCYALNHELVPAFFVLSADYSVFCLAFCFLAGLAILHFKADE